MPALLNLITAFTGGSIFFLAFLIYSRRREANPEANFWLSIFLVSIGILILDDCFLQFKIYRSIPWLIGYPDLFVYSIAPSLYLSIYYFTSPKTGFSRLDWLHFLPFVVMIFVESSFIFQSGAYKLGRLDYYEQGRPPIEPSFLVFIGIIMAYTAVYLLLSFTKLRKHQKNVKLFAASIESINLNWLRYFLYGVFFMFSIWISSGLFRLDFFITYESIGYFFIVYFLGYYAMGQPSIFPFSEQEKKEIAIIMAEENQPVTVDKRKMFREAELQELKNQLMQLMQKEKPFLDNELKLPKLAKMMRINTHEMSYLLNEGFQENFFQFVNRYRIEESKRLLANPETYALHSMVGIAFEAGFNSKTTFNTAFKKATGYSPSEYQKMSLERELS